MAYDSSKPAGDDSIAASHAPIRANFAQIVANFSNEHAWSNDTAASCVHASNFFVGVLTRELDATAGDVETTGVGFTPDIVLFYGIGRTDNTSLVTSFGGYDGTNHGCVFNSETVGAPNTNSSSTYCIYFCEGNHLTNYQRAVVKSLDADGFTLTWSTDSMESTSQEGKIFYICLKMV